MLSVIVPVFNEVRTLPRVLVAVSRALPGVEKEVILVEDGSDDGTRQWIAAQFPAGPRSASRLDLDAEGNLLFLDAAAAARTVIRPVFHATNRGKGACLAAGFAAARGQVIVIQDADLEYDPADWQPMYEAIAVRRESDVVYGSRFLGGRSRWRLPHHYVANRLLSFLFNILYGQRISDVEVCYKMISAEVKDSLDITCPGFGCEIQVSAQIALARRWRIREMGIRYHGRTRAEGKKIRWMDGVKAVWQLAAYRFASRDPSSLRQAMARVTVHPARRAQRADETAGRLTEVE